MQKRYLNYNGKKLQPNDFNNEVISQLSSDHASTLRKVYSKLEEQIPAYIFKSYKSRFERHLFPALTLAVAIDAINDNFIDYCVSFVRGYSIPILMLDEILDTTKELDRQSLIYVYQNIYEAEAALAKLPNGQQVIRKINYVYSLVTASLIFEVQNRQRILTPDFINAYSLSYDPHGYHRSVCGYFSSVIGGVLALNSIALPERAEQLLGQFGVLRQVSNEIGDVEEDLKSGIITLPIILTLKKYPIYSLVSSYWAGQIEFHFIEEYIKQADAYRLCFNLGLDLYSSCLHLKNELLNEYPFLNDLFVFYELKLCVLYRLEENGWRDNYKRY